MMFDQLDKYSFSKKNIDLIPRYFSKGEKQKVQLLKKVEQKDLSLFIPKYKDTLFWCYYILINGVEKYEMIRKDFSEEKMIKIALIQTIRANKDILKKFKIKRTFIEDELLNQQVISIKTFFILCVLKEINIVVKDKYKYIEHNVDSSEIKIIEKSAGKYGLLKKSCFCREKYWKMQGLDFENPLRPFSRYKLKDLQDICQSLGLKIKENGKNIKKADLYQMIRIKIE